MAVDDPDATPTQNLISRGNRLVFSDSTLPSLYLKCNIPRRVDDLPDAAEDLFYNRNPNARPSNASGSAPMGLPLALQATLRCVQFVRIPPSLLTNIC